MTVTGFILPIPDLLYNILHKRKWTAYSSTSTNGLMILSLCFTEKDETSYKHYATRLFLTKTAQLVDVEHYYQESAVEKVDDGDDQGIENEIEE